MTPTATQAALEKGTVTITALLESILCSLAHPVLTLLTHLSDPHFMQNLLYGQRQKAAQAQLSPSGLGSRERDRKCSREGTGSVCIRGEEPGKAGVWGKSQSRFLSLG